MSKISAIKTESREERYNYRSYGIQGWGKDNDYPQRVGEIVESSITGKSCVEIYAKFIAGRGFAEESLYTTVVNEEGTTVDDILRSISKDYALLGGFALHFNYNALGEIVSISHIPMEWVRFETLDDNFEWSKVAIHPDWGHRADHLHRFLKSDIEFFYKFDPRPVVIADEVVASGGWENYKGQVYVYSNNGANTYPTPIFKPAIINMSIEQGLSNIAYRNTRHNYLPAGIFIDVDNSANSEEQAVEKMKQIEAFQGDDEVGNILYMNVANGDEKPQFIPLKTNNYDKDYANTETATPLNIGRAFSQPPILRAEDVGNNFGADAMENAYNFYNSITESERLVISDVFKRIFSLWHDQTINPEGNYDILPKEYQITRSLAEKLGDNIDKVLEILGNTTLSEQTKDVLLSKLYGLEDADISDLLTAYRILPSNNGDL